MKNKTRRALTLALVGGLVTLSSLSSGAWAADLPADLQAKVEKAKKRLIELAADPAVLAAVREANGQDVGGMSNGKWADLEDGAAPIKTLLAKKVSLQIAKWEAADDTINKLLLRDQKGNIVGASTRPLVFNAANRPPFSNPIKGQPWSANEIKPDPTTQVPSVQVGVPVLDGGKTIGVMSAGVTVK